MSYILDALNRADAERERSAAPGLHTRHQVPAGNPETPRASRPLGLAMAVGMALLMLGLGVWFWRAPAAPSSTNAPPAVATPLPPAAVPAAPPVPVTALVPVPDAPQDKVPPIAAPGAAPAVPAVSAAAPALPTVAPLLAELPQELRSQIPKITITGSVYSDTPTQRLLLVNNQVLSPGSLLSHGLSLEEIQPRSSVFSFKGTRFRVMH